MQGEDSIQAVYALRDLDGDGAAAGPGESVPVTEQMSCPNGVAFLGRDLYVAQKDKILKYADVETDLATLKTPTVFVGMESPVDSGSGLPDTNWHGWRYLSANPRTNKLYVTIGSPCNVPGPPGRLSALSVFHIKSSLYGVFVWARPGSLTAFLVVSGPGRSQAMARSWTARMWPRTRSWAPSPRSIRWRLAALCSRYGSVALSLLHYHSSASYDNR